MSSVAQAHEALAKLAQHGRARANGGAGVASGPAAPAPAPHPDDARLAEIMRRRDLLGDDPPRFTIEANDRVYSANGAHTDKHHGPGIPLPRGMASRTIEGRIYGDGDWANPENWSFRWTDPTTMNRVINDFIHQNWPRIRDDLALDGRHESKFDAGRRVGEGYYNDGMYGVGPRNSHYAETSFVKIRMKIVAGSDPPEPFIVTAFPLGIM